MAERNPSAELEAARRRLVEHPGYKEHQELEALGLSLEAVFGVNLRELIAMLDAAATDEVLAFELIQNVRPPEVRDRFREQLTRRLHNYLASAQSLVDHVRRLMRGREGPIADEFRKRKEELLLNPEVPFMVDLRNYTLHRTLPFFGHTLTMSNINTPDQTMESEVELSVVSLLEWDRWSARSRAYLESVGDTVALRPVVKKHGELVFALNSWLLTDLGHANRGLLAEVNELVVAFNTVMTGDREVAERRARRAFT